MTASSISTFQILDEEGIILLAVSHTLVALLLSWQLLDVHVHLFTIHTVVISYLITICDTYIKKKPTKTTQNPILTLHSNIKRLILWWKE